MRFIIDQKERLFLLIDSIICKKHNNPLLVSILFTIFEPLIGFSDSDYFHCGNVGELTSKLHQVITHPLERLEYDMSKYDWDKIADQTVKVYKEMDK